MNLNPNLNLNLSVSPLPFTLPGPVVPEWLRIAILGAVGVVMMVSAVVAWIATRRRDGGPS